MSIGLQRPECIFDRRTGKETAMWIDRVVASVPEKCRREAGDPDVGNCPIQARYERVLNAVADIPTDAIRDSIFVAHRPACLQPRHLRSLEKCAALAKVRAATERVTLEHGDLNRDLPRPDKRLAVCEEGVLPRAVLGLDDLQP